MEVEVEGEAAVDVTWDCSISPGGVRYRAPRCANKTHIIRFIAQCAARARQINSDRYSYND